MLNKPLIGWIKWKNPYSADEEHDDNLENDNDDIELEENEVSSVPHQGLKMVVTPMGVIPLPEHSAPQKVFNLWMAHTNFDITRNILNLVEKTDGVETVDVFTRYRMRVGIGKMFNTQETIRRINNVLYEALAPQESGNYGSTQLFGKK